MQPKTVQLEFVKQLNIDYMKKIYQFTAIILGILTTPVISFASEADLKIPDAIHSAHILYWGFLITVLGLFFGLYQFKKVKSLPAHRTMLEIGDVIYKTCGAYLRQQGKFLAILFIFIGAAVAAYFGFLAKDHEGHSLLG